MIKRILRTRFAYRFNKMILNNKYVKIYLRENSIAKQFFLKNISFFKVNQLDFDKPFENVLVQQVDHHKFTIKLGMVVKAFSKKNNIKVYSYSPYFNKRLGWIDMNEKRYFNLFKTFTSRIYKKMGYTYLFSLDDNYFDDKVVEKLFNLKYEKLNSINELLNFEIEGIVIGDLIYDTYLRFYERHTIDDLSDSKLKELIFFSINNFFLIKNFIEKYSISTLFTTYTSYTNHGLAVRICLDKKIPVYTIGDDSSIVQQISREYPYSVCKYWEFKNIKLAETLQNEIENELNYRFSGGIDNAISYMKVTSFTKLNVEKYSFDDRRNRNVIIYVHDLFDSPHWLKKFQFQDYFKYITELSEQIKNDIFTRYYIKLHPNAGNISNEVVINYLTDLASDSITILPLEITNNEIISFRPDLVVTVNGTVGLEMACFNIPVVALVDNLYMNFSFVHSCLNLNEYYSVIKGEIPYKVKFNKEEIYSYYYQAYKQNLIQFDNEILPYLNSGSYIDLDDFLDDFNNNKEKLFNNEILNNINSILK